MICLTQNFLAIDIGTEGIKVAVFDVEGNCLASSYEEYELKCPKPGWAEQDPNTWWQATVRNVRAVLSSVSPDEIAAVGVCGQMHAPIPIDKEGNVLYRSSLLWCDKRNIKQCENLKKKIDEEQLLSITGNPITTAWMGLKILWIKENLPSAVSYTHLTLPTN